MNAPEIKRMVSSRYEATEIGDGFYGPCLCCGRTLQLYVVRPWWDLYGKHAFTAVTSPPFMTVDFWGATTK